MSPDQQLIAVIRFINVALWIWLGADLWVHHDYPLSGIARRLVIAVMVAGMLILFIGSFAPNLPDGLTRNLYTMYTGFAAMSAFAIKATWR